MLSNGSDSVIGLSAQEHDGSILRSLFILSLGGASMVMDRDMRIRRRAHEIWEREGRPEGRAEAHWMRAEREVADQERVGRNGIGCSGNSKSEAEGLPSRATGTITELASHTVSTGLRTIGKIAEPAKSPSKGRRTAKDAAATSVAPADEKAAAPAGKVRPLPGGRGKAADASGPGGTVRPARTGTRPAEKPRDQARKNLGSRRGSSWSPADIWSDNPVAGSLEEVATTTADAEKTGRSRRAAVDTRAKISIVE
jgi:hypothetical protein